MYCVLKLHSLGLRWHKTAKNDSFVTPPAMSLVPNSAYGLII